MDNKAAKLRGGIPKALHSKFHRELRVNHGKASKCENPHFVSCQTVKAGGHVTMGTDAGTIHKLLTGEYTCALYVVKSEQFFDRKNNSETPIEEQSGDYWKRRCEAAEKVISLRNRPYCYEQDQAFNEWEKLFKQKP